MVTIPQPPSAPASPKQATTVLGELSEIGLTKDELAEIAAIADDPRAAEVAGAWFDSKRQVALAVAAGGVAAAVAALVGDATVVGTAHGVFSGDPEIGSIAGLTGMFGASGIVAGYYFNKVRRIANKSLHIQHIFNTRRRQS
jgi:hypothetical protein